MKLRTYLSDHFGGIKEALAYRSTVAAVIHGLDTRAGKRGADGKNGKVGRKNPFRGIAHSNGSAYGPRFFRRVDGARDSRPTFHTRYRDALVRAIVSASKGIQFRDSNPIPCAFLP